MTDNPEAWTDAGADGPEAMLRLLRDPAVWAQPSADVGDRVLASIAAEQAARTEAADDRASETDVGQRWPPPAHPASRSDTSGVPSVTGPLSVPTSAPDNVVELDRAADRRADRPLPRRRRLPLAAAAAVVVLALGALAAVTIGSDESPEGQTVALAPTELATDGAVVAEVTELRNGVRIVLDLSGLPPAPDGFFYQAWLVRPEPRNAVSAGTFHLRGGDGSIELWAGVSTGEYTTLSVTLSPESDPTSPGDRLFVGQLEPNP